MLENFISLSFKHILYIDTFTGESSGFIKSAIDSPLRVYTLVRMYKRIIGWRNARNNEPFVAIWTQAFQVIVITYVQGHAYSRNECIGQRANVIRCVKADIHMVCKNIWTHWSDERQGATAFGGVTPSNAYI